MTTLESAQPAATTTDLVLPQRVQIRMRGVRFETTVDVLSMYSGTYRRFFDEWRSDSALRDSILAVVDPSKRKEESTIDADAIAEATTAVLGKVFTSMCIPVDAPFHPPIRQATLLMHSATSKVPALDSTGLFWFWDFSVLKDESLPEAAATTSGKFGAVTSPKNELQPEFTGLIFVFLRKSYQQRQQQGDAAVAGPPKPIKFCARWDEMPYDQQRSLCDVVNVLDITLLKDMGYGVPTADPAAGDGYVDNGGDPAAAVDTTMVDKALEYLAIQRNIHNPQGTTRPHPSTEDDTLEMPATGCAKCGTSGHPTESCPF
jgi:hypothetical protein